MPTNIGELMQGLLQRSVTAPPPVAERPALANPATAEALKVAAPDPRNAGGDFSRRNGNIVGMGQSALQEAMARRNRADQAKLQQTQAKLMAGIKPRQVNVNLGPGQTDFGGKQISVPTGSGQYRGPRPTTPTGSFGAFMKAIGAKESGGSYNARNRDSGAMGKYQIMPGNIKGNRGWDYEALGRNISTTEFMRSPQIQEQIAQYKLKQYYNKWGPRGAAIAWYAGPGAVSRYSSAALNAPQGKYPSISGYAADILRRLGL